MSANISVASLQERSRIADAKKSRMGVIYAVMGGPALGLSFGLLAQVGANPPFITHQPAGTFALIALLMVPFGLIGCVVFLLVSGHWRDAYRLFGHRISWWTLFVGTGGFVGDLCYVMGAALVGGSLAGPIAGMMGVAGAIVTSVLYRERILSWSTLVGVIGIVAGVWLVLTGGTFTAPTNGIYLIIGLAIMVGAVINWGFENFAIDAGSDLMPAEGYLFWRVCFELVIAIVLLLVLFPFATNTAVQVWTDPRLISYGAIIGLGWALWMLMSFYIGISYAGATKGGLIAPSVGFFLVGFFSLTVYGEPFTTVIVVGSALMFVGAASIVVEPTKYLARRRIVQDSGDSYSETPPSQETVSRLSEDARLAQEYLSRSASFKKRRLAGLTVLCLLFLAPFVVVYVNNWWGLAGGSQGVGQAWVLVGICVVVLQLGSVLVDARYRREL